MSLEASRLSYPFGGAGKSLCLQGLAQKKVWEQHFSQGKHPAIVVLKGCLCYLVLVS